MKKAFPVIVLFFVAFVARSQNVSYGNYVSNSGPFGQFFVQTQLADNVLYSATSRFGVTSTVTGSIDGLFDANYDGAPVGIGAGSTAVISIDFTAKGGIPIVYGGGLVSLNFYYQNIPASVSGRVQTENGSWIDMTGWVNRSYKSDCAVWQGAVPDINYIKTLEITIVAASGIYTALNEVEYIMQRPGQYEPGVLTKFTNQSIFKNFYWVNSNSVLSAAITSDGSAVFNTSLALGTASPTAQFHSTGSVRFAGITNNNSFTRLMVSDADGNLYYRDASTLGGGADGWLPGGNTVSTATSLGTSNNFDLPFITNNTERMRIGINGNVGIGTANISDASYKLFVEGAIRARKLKVDNTTWPDYVFGPGYHLPSLSEIGDYISKYRHLPEIPSAADVKRDGLDVSENQAALLKKIEELTLYLIEQNKKIVGQDERIRTLESRLIGK